MKGGRPTLLLVNPWIVDFAAYDLWSKPLGLLMIADMMIRNGCECHILDCLDRFDPFFRDRYRGSDISFRADGTGHYPKNRIDKPSQLAHVPRYYSRYGWPPALVEKRLRQTGRPDAVFVTSGMTYWYPGVRDFISLVKTIFPGVPVILGGIYASLLPAHAADTSGADMVLPGRAEETLPELMRSLFGRSFLWDRTVFSAPTYELYPVLQSAMLLTSRGCPYRCPFCASGLLYPGFMQQDPVMVAEEISHLHVKRGVDHFAFADDALLHRKDHHFLPLLDALLKRKLTVSFYTPNGLQPGKIDGPTARLMKAAGFRNVQLSFESSDESRQAAMQFKVVTAELETAVEHLFNAGFSSAEIGCYVLTGLPEQTSREVVESVEVVLRLGVRVNLASFSPIPGTAYWPREWIADGGAHSAVDPLLTNNSIFPLASDEAAYHSMQQLRTAMALANVEITHGLPPLQNPVVLAALHKFAT